MLFSIGPVQFVWTQSLKFGVSFDFFFFLNASYDFVCVQFLINLGVTKHNEI